MKNHIKCRSSVGRILGLLAVAMAAQIATPAHAESGSRICGVQMQINSTRSGGFASVGFFQKVNKGDNDQCARALYEAGNGFLNVGGTNDKGANRVWRRVRGGSVGPFWPDPSSTVTTWDLSTCETFTQNATKVKGDICNGMSRNKTYVFAARTGDLQRR